MNLNYKIYIAVLFFLSMYSCKNDEAITEDEKVMTYTVIIKENDQNSAYLKENIKELLS